MGNGLTYVQLKGWASCQDWVLVREMSITAEDYTFLVGWFLTPRGNILQVESLDGVNIACLATVALMPSEEALEVHKPKKKPRRDEDERPR